MLVLDIRIHGDKELVEGVVELAGEEPLVEGREEGLGDLLVGDTRQLRGRGGGGGGGLVRGDVPAVLFAGEGELVKLFADVFALLGGDLGGLGEW